jgi:hypothetical protein
MDCLGYNFDQNLFPSPGQSLFFPSLDFHTCQVVQIG